MIRTLGFLLLLIPFISMAQSPAYDTLRDEKNGSLIMRGNVTFDDLNKEPSFGWMQTGAAEYSTHRKAMKVLKQQLPKYKVLVFMGTWCGDSKELIPQLYKVLTEAGYPLANVKMYGVDRTKTTPNGANEKYKITNVPTIILIDTEREMGRITESVHKNMENDLAEIILRYQL